MATPRFRPVVSCPRCGKAVTQRASGQDTIAHKCPHGVACSLPLHTRPRKACLECHNERELAKLDVVMQAVRNNFELRGRT